MHPRSDEAPTVASGQGFQGQVSADISDCAEDTGRGKVLANLRAAFALAGGYVVHELADGSFLVCWRNLTKPCPDLAAVRAFGHLVGALR
jgi:hypothetical protein